MFCFGGTLMSTGSVCLTLGCHLPWVWHQWQTTYVGYGKRDLGQGLWKCTPVSSRR